MDDLRRFKDDRCKYTCPFLRGTVVPYDTLYSCTLYMSKVPNRERCRQCYDGARVIIDTTSTTKVVP